MAYPSLGAGVPTFDQWGNAYGVNPVVSKQSAGAMATGQSLFSAAIRGIDAVTLAGATIPLTTVPNNMVLFITDIQSSIDVSSTPAQTYGDDIQIQAGAIPIMRAAISNTGPMNEMFETQPFVPPGITLQVAFPTPATARNFDLFIAGYFQQFGF